MPASAPSASEYVDLRSIDYDALARDLNELRGEIEAEIGPADVAHLRRIERRGRACAALGLATAWIAPNPISAGLLALANGTRWAILMHHVGHRGMDRAVERARAQGVEAPASYSSKVFAQGRRRVVDWLDWMLPEAWHLEHDVLHHSHTGELLDPDVVEENMKAVRDSAMPRALKLAISAFFACTWKVTYYAPNTFQVWKRAERTREARRAGTLKPHEALPGVDRIVDAFDPRTADGREFLRKCMLPYGLARFIATPALFLPLGPGAVASVAANVALAELLANLHSFAIIAPNHAGDDVYRFDGPARDKAEYYVRQIVGSVNTGGGTEIADWLLGYLNYQIEHHLWPDLPPLRLRQAAPRVRAICAKHGVPYLQQPVTARLRKLVAIMVGDASMKRARTLSKKERAQAAATA
jgi:fatty acid desaturase